MAFLIYEHLDYKKVLKERIKELKKYKAKFSLQFLANTLDIQYTFLSKVLNSDKHQLSEDQIFSAGYALEFLDDEVEYLLLLRSHQATNNPTRKNFLFQKISNIQKRSVLSVSSAEITPAKFNHDMRYLMDYHAMVVHAALSIKSIQRKPYALAPLLGLDTNRVKEILILLDQLARIEYNPKTNEIKKILHPRLHFGKDHPLIRMHQLMMKTNLNHLSLNKPEDKKENLFITFTSDPAGFEKIKKQLKNFTSELQKTTIDHNHTGVYQMNLDFIQLFET